MRYRHEKKKVRSRSKIILNIPIRDLVMIYRDNNNYSKTSK